MYTPTIIDSKKGERYYDLYSKLLEERIIFLTGEINDSKSSIIIAELLYLDSLNHNDIQLYIMSPGGIISSGLAIIDTMNLIKSDVSTISIGLTASMAAVILSCGKKGKRYALKNSEIMLHQPLGGADGQASDILIHAEHIIALKNRITAILSENTGKDRNKVNTDTDRDLYLTSDEAIEYGLIDKIL